MVTWRGWISRKRGMPGSSSRLNNAALQKPLLGVQRTSYNDHRNDEVLGSLYSQPKNSRTWNTFAT